MEFLLEVAIFQQVCLFTSNCLITEPCPAAHARTVTGCAEPVFRNEHVYWEKVANIELELK